MNFFDYSIWLVIFILITFAITLLSKPKGNEYRINKYLTLKHENNQTVIYVNNKPFRQCLYLLLNIKTDDLGDFEEIDSIDKAAEKLDGSMENNFSVRNNIGSDTEFWGHCSNLQAWAENDYDTRILHRNLAFPLLKKLVEVGDSKAKKVFKDEIALRIASNHPTVINYLVQEGYLRFLSGEELEAIFEEIELQFLERPVEDLIRMLKNSENIHKGRLTHTLNRIFGKFNLNQIPYIFSRIKTKFPEELKETSTNMIFEFYQEKNEFPKIEFINNNIEYFELEEHDFIRYENRVIGIFQEEKIVLKNQKIADLNKIEGLENRSEQITEIDLSNNLLKDVIGIEAFEQLKILNLNNNQIEIIDGLESLKNLEYVSLRKNRISKIDKIEKLKHLEVLDLSKNVELKEIPENLSKSPSLKVVKFWNCNIQRFDDTVKQFFWNNQNYRYFTGFNPEAIRYYERTHSSKARSHVDGGLYKNFVRWVLGVENLRKKYNFSYHDLNDFEETMDLNAVWSGKVTRAFKKWLFDKDQTKITDFIV